MRLTLAIFSFLFFFAAPNLRAQQSGFFAGPSALVGFDYISKIYHPQADSGIAPANKGFNVAFQFGGVAGYKFKKLGFQAEFKTSNFQQNLKQEDLVGDFTVRYNTFGAQFLYQLGEINLSDYFHTIKLGWLYNTPKYGHYLVKNNSTGDIYADEDQLYALQSNHMLSIEYGITKGYKLLWADFSLRAAYNITNIYKPLTATNGKNFFLGFQLAFGLFANTNK